MEEYSFWLANLKTLIEQIRPALPQAPWLQTVINHWETQIEIDGGGMALNLDRFPQDNEKREHVLSSATLALMRTPEISRKDWPGQPVSAFAG